MNKELDARHKYATRRLDAIDYLIKRPNGTTVQQLAKGMGVSLATAERYLVRLKANKDIELLKETPIKGVSRRPIKYYVTTPDAELEYLERKKGRTLNEHRPDNEQV